MVGQAAADERVDGGEAILIHRRKVWPGGCGCSFRRALVSLALRRDFAAVPGPAIDPLLPLIRT